MDKIKDSKKITSVLKELLGRNKDAELVFKKGMNDAESNLLKDFLNKQSQQRSRFANELEKEVYQIDISYVHNCSFQEKFGTQWMDSTEIFKVKDDAEILNACIKGEEHCVRDYEKTINGHDFPDDVLRVLNGQLDEMKFTISSISGLKDLETY